MTRAKCDTENVNTQRYSDVQFRSISEVLFCVRFGIPVLRQVWNSCFASGLEFLFCVRFRIPVLYQVWNSCVASDLEFPVLLVAWSGLVEESGNIVGTF